MQGISAATDHKSGTAKESIEELIAVQIALVKIQAREYTNDYPKLIFIHH